jgi:hypothetical protein
MALTNDITSKETNNNKYLEYLDAYQYDILIGVKKGEVSVLKDRYKKQELSLDFSQIQDVALDLLTRGLEIHDIKMFSEPFKQELKDKIQEVIIKYKT